MSDEADEEKKNHPDLGDVRDPVTGAPISDPILRLAVKERHYRIVNGKTQIHWAGLMKSRRLDDRTPRYQPLTQSQAALLHQLREDAFMGMRQVSNLLGFKTLEAGVRFL